MATDVQIPVAESSPAAAPATPATPATPELRTLKSLSPAEHTEWRKTGNMPEAKPPSKEDSATSEESAASGEPDGESVPASEAGKEAQGNKNKRSDAGSRIKELLAENKRLKDAAAVPKTEKPAESSPAAQPEPPKALEAPKKPNAKDFDGKPYEEYETAFDKYIEDLTEYKAKKAIQEQRQQDEQVQQSKRIESEFEAAKELYPDFEDKAKPVMTTLLNDKSIPEPFKAAVGTSDVFTHLIYALSHENAQKLFELAKTNAISAIKKLGELEGAVRAELAKSKPAAKGKETPQRNENGQFVPGSEGKPPVKTVTDRGKPPAEVGGTGNAPADETADALKRGSFADYSARQNAKDLAKTK